MDNQIIIAFCAGAFIFTYIVARFFSWYSKWRMSHMFMSVTPTNMVNQTKSSPVQKSGNNFLPTVALIILVGAGWHYFADTGRSTDTVAAQSVSFPHDRVNVKPSKMGKNAESTGKVKPDQHSSNFDVERMQAMEQPAPPYAEESGVGGQLPDNNYPNQASTPYIEPQDFDTQEESITAQFTLQAGVFKTFEACLSTAKELEKASKEEVTIEMCEMQGDTMFKALVGSFEDREAANKTASRLKKKGMSCFVRDMSKFPLERKIETAT